MRTYKLVTFLCLVGMLGICHADESLHVSIQPPKGETGNMHYSELMRLQLGDSHPVLLETNLEHGTLAPSDVLLTKRLNKKIVVAFAWSSTGSESETFHAILLSHVSNATVMRDHLQMNVRRGTGGFLFTGDGALYVLQPRERPDDSLLFLESNKIALRCDRMRTLRFVPSPEHARLICSPYENMIFGGKNFKVAKIVYFAGEFRLPKSTPMGSKF